MKTLFRCGLIVLILMLASCATSTATQSSMILPTPSVSPSMTAIAPTPQPTNAPQPSMTPIPSPTAEPEISLAFVGDVMLARSIGERIVSDGANLPFAGVRDELRQSDLTIANLECVVADAGVPAPKAYRFLAPPASIASLTDAGIDLVSLANNHSLDWGDAALLETQHLLNDAKIGFVGSGANVDQAHVPLIIERNGMKLAFLAYVNVPIEVGGFDMATWTATDTSAGVAWAEPEQIRQDIAAIKPSVDHVIILLHSGYEGQDTPNEIQRTNAYAALDAGATLVIGAHPHVLQGYERHDTGQLIAWSLGNFVFDGFEGTPSTDSAILHITLDRTGVTNMRWTPVRIENGFPIALDPNGEGAAILARIEELSK